MKPVGRVIAMFTRACLYKEERILKLKNKTLATLVKWRLYEQMNKRSEVLRAVVMKSSIFWAIIVYSVGTHSTFRRNI
jgi:hypothetical protein